MADLQPSRYSGGQQVKASTLNRGDYVRDPKRTDRVMVVVETGSTIFIRGLDEEDIEKHRFLSPDQFVIKVTNCTTETSVLPKEGVGQE